MPRMVKKLIASAASLTRNRRENEGRALSGKATCHPQVRSRCQAQPGTSTSGNASPSRRTSSMVSARLM